MHARAFALAVATLDLSGLQTRVFAVPALAFALGSRKSRCDATCPPWYAMVSLRTLLFSRASFFVAG
jgi:hypothetical protein